MTSLLAALRAVAMFVLLFGLYLVTGLSHGIALAKSALTGTLFSRRVKPETADSPSTP